MVESLQQPFQYLSRVAGAHTKKTYLNLPKPFKSTMGELGPQSPSCIVTHIGNDYRNPKASLHDQGEPQPQAENCETQTLAENCVFRSRCGLGLELRLYYLCLFSCVCKQLMRACEDDRLCIFFQGTCLIAITEDFGTRRTSLPVGDISFLRPTCI